jgi:hypothetical protein
LWSKDAENLEYRESESTFSSKILENEEGVREREGGDERARKNVTTDGFERVDVWWDSLPIEVVRRFKFEDGDSRRLVSFFAAIWEFIEATKFGDEEEEDWKRVEERNFEDHALLGDDDEGKVACWASQVASVGATKVGARATRRENMNESGMNLEERGRWRRRSLRVRLLDGVRFVGLLQWRKDVFPATPTCLLCCLWGYLVWWPSTLWEATIDNTTTRRIEGTKMHVLVSPSVSMQVDAH